MIKKNGIKSKKNIYDGYIIIHYNKFSVYIILYAMKIENRCNGDFLKSLMIEDIF